MANLDGFDANQVEPDKGFGLMPKGDYNAVITDSELKNTTAGTGQYLALTFQILDGQFQNRKLWENLNIKNPNPDTVRIAKGQLSAICRATGVMTPKDSSELHNKPLKISVGIGKDQNGQKNRIVGYKPRNAGPAAPAPTPGAVGGQAAPW